MAVQVAMFGKAGGNFRDCIDLRIREQQFVENLSSRDPISQQVLKDLVISVAQSWTFCGWSGHSSPDLVREPFSAAILMEFSDTDQIVGPAEFEN